MADRKISELTNITGANLADADEFVVVDTSASETKAITRSELGLGINKLGYNGTQKIITTSTGVDVTGTVTADGLIFDAADFINITAKESLAITIDSDNNQSSRNFTIFNDGTTKKLFRAEDTGDISFYEDTGTTPKFFWDASAERLGIGTSSPSYKLDLTSSSDGYARQWISSQSFVSSVDNSAGFQIRNLGAGTTGVKFSNYANNAEWMRIDSSGNVGIGVVPSAWYFLDTALQIKNSFINQNSAGSLVLGNNYYTNASNQSIYLASSAASRYFQSNGSHNWSIAPSGTAGNAITFTQAMTLDASGNLLVGTTSNAPTTTAGINLGSNNKMHATRSGGASAYFNRLTSDGGIVEFAKDGTTVGSIGASGGDFYVGNGTRSLMWTGTSVFPRGGTGGISDATVDLGNGSNRFDDIYAANALIQTSDANEKQDIAELDEAERRVAVATKGLLRKFRWKDAVAEKGDDARIHFGIIAQDLQAAFEAEGLDAGRYAMFIHTTWTDEETGEERSRMGVRYSELLAFIIAAI